MAISTTSFNLTPQATGDTFVYTEDTSGVLTLDVMSNDLGGAAKTLYSLDDGLENDGTTGSDLLIKDTARAEATSTDTSLNGAKIWITSDGKVGYDSSTLTTSFKAALQALGDGQTMTDPFTYAIRMANGTLSWTTATVVYTGVNDAPVLTDPANISFVDTSAGDTFTAATGTLHATDVDSPTITFGLTGGAADNSLAGYDVSKASAYGTMYLNTGTGDYTFVPNDAAINGLHAGDTPAINFEFTASDGSLSSAQTLTVNITGANDNPTLTNPTDFSLTDTSAHDSFSAQTGSLAAADVDSAGSGFSYALTGAVSDNTHAGFDLAASSAYGTMYLNSATGAYEFVADDAAVNALQAGDNPTVSFTFTVNDGDGGSASQTLDVNITGANDAPTLTDPTDISITDTSAADSFSPSTGSLSASDVDSTGLTYDVNGSVADNTHAGFDLAASSAYGTMYLNSATGAYEFVADDAAVNALQAGDNPTVGFTFTVNDGDGGSASQTLDVNITGANDAPTLTDPTDISITDTSAADSFSAQTGSLVAADVDSASSGFSYDVSGSVADNSHAGFDLAASSAYGTMYLNSSTGAYEFVADDAAVNALQAGDNPTVSFTFTVNDGDGASASQTLDVNITGANDAPTLTDPTDIGITDTSAADSFSASSGSLSASDVDSASSGFSYDINGSVSDNSHAGYDLAASSAYGTMYLNSATGAYEFVADDAAVNALQVGDNPTVSFTFTVNDGDGGSASQTLDVNITGTNDAPTLTDPTDISITDTVAADSFSASSGSLSASDVDSASSGFSYDVTGSVADNSHVGFNLAASSAYGTMYLNSSTGAYEFVADDAAVNALQAGDNPTVSFTFTVNDGDGGSASQTLDVNITGANDAPTLTDPTDIGITDTSAADSFSAQTGSLVAADVDSASSGFSYDINGSVADNSHAGFDLAASSAYGTMYLNSSTGAYEFVADDAAVNALQAGDNPTVSFTFTVNDGDGGSASQTLDVNITGANDAPTLTDPTDISITDTSAADSFSAQTGSLVAADVDSTGLTYDVNGSVADNSHAGFDLAASSVYGTMYLNSATGAYEFVADDAAVNALQAGDNPTVSFTFTVNDGDGGSASQTLDVNITGANDAPVINELTSDLAPSGLEDNAILGTIVAGDVDSAALTYSAPAQGDPNGPVHGSVSFDSSGGYTYTPDANYNGADSFTVTVSDGAGGSDTVVVNVTVTPVNDAPVLSDPTDITYTDTSAADDFTGVTGSLSASDIDSATLSYSLTGSAADASLAGYDVSKASTYGTMYLNTTTGAYHFEPNDAAINGLAAGSNPTVDFEFTASDGSATSNAQTLTVHLTGADEVVANSPPDAVNDLLLISSGSTAATFSAAALLGNDTDPNNDTLHIVSVSGTGVSYDAVHQTIAYTTGAAGSFTYTVDDGHGNTDTATVQVQVVTPTSSGSNDTYSLSSMTYQGSYIDAGGGTDSITGGAGYDTFLGGTGNDTLVGGASDDRLVGGNGADSLTGNAGADVFVYTAAVESGGASIDTITDFTHGVDKIDVSAIDAISGGADNAFAFVAADTNGAVANSITWHYDSGSNTTHIFGDTNGSGGAEFEIVLTGHITLSSGDFIL